MAGGHKKEVPKSITYFSLSSHDSIHIGFLLASLHSVDTNAIDMDNVNLNAPRAEKIWFVGGNECGKDKCCVLLIVRALYSLRSTDLSWI